MAMFKDSANMHVTADPQFDQIHNPGATAPHSGIYRCIGCGHEIGISRGRVLPSESHPHAPSLGKIQWKLLVYAQPKG
jgi:hypothetical protein